MKNHQMCEIVTLRCKNRQQAERIEELERMLVRASNKLESYDGTEFFVAKINMILENNNAK
ncbi:coil containing protein [Vibrio phage 1.246.O._10N.261.54.E10]|nr:coil containing protein [Vibrio phage 1.246.O._10N.261.54.E10]